MKRPLKLGLDAKKKTLLDERLRARGLAVDAPRIPPRPQREQAPLSRAQERLWVLHALDPSSTAYHEQLVLRVRGRLDAHCLRASFEALIARHEILRTTFHPGDGDRGPNAVQRIRPAMALRLREEPIARVPVDTNADAGVDADPRLRVLAARERHEPFDLNEGPLFRLLLIARDADEHVLVLTIHHIISDGWSMGILARELAEVYAATREGRSADLAPMPIQYADFAAWEREQDGRQPASIEHFRRRLEGAPPLLPLPTDHARRETGADAGVKTSSRLDRATTERLDALTRVEDTTFHVAILTLVAVQLSRDAATRDLVLGAVLSGRRQAETEELFGFFLNLLPTRVLVDERLSLRQLIRRVHASWLEDEEHSAVSFADLVSALTPERVAGAGPFFNVLLSTQNMPGATFASSEITLEPIVLEEAAAKYDLVIEAARGPDDLRIAWIHAAALFEPATIERLVARFVRLCEVSLAAPDLPLCSIERLLPDERCEVLRASRGAVEAFSSGDTVHEHIVARAREAPEDIAVVFDGSLLTYAELDAWSDALAEALVEAGVRLDDAVGLCVERSLEMIVGIVGILKAGAAYVPLEPEHPAARLETLIGAAGIRLLVTSAANRPRALEIGTPHVVASEVRERKARPLARRVDRKNAAYTLFTSGSTGEPKGVTNTHEGLLNRVFWFQARYPLDRESVVLQKTPFTFDVSVWELVWPLMVGARLVIARPGDHRDPSAIALLVEREGITHLHFVPSMLGPFLDEPGLDRLRSLQRTFASGEALDPSLAKLHKQRVRGELTNLYGPTEAAIDVTYWDRPAAYEGELVPIGRPVANTQVHVLDEHLRAVPVGVTGELYLAGVQLARGYAGRADLTADAFVPSPFVPGERLYRTGDLGRLRRDGEIEYLGRRDSQVKVRGQRVELGEIEVMLRAQRGVRDGAVIATKRAATTQLVAYVVLDPSAGRAVADVTASLREVLPDFMVPAHWVTLDAMPFTSSGKLDRRALPAPTIASVAAGADDPPATPTERAIAEIMASVLGLPSVSATSNFFALGGDSIISLQVTARLRARGISVSARQVLERPTVRALAEVVVVATVVVEDEDIPAGDVPLSPTQQAFLEHGGPEPAHFNQAIAFEWDDDVDAGALELACGELQRRHAALRHRFGRNDEGAWSQWIEPTASARVVREESIVGLGAREAREKVSAVANELHRSLDLSRGPLLRVALFRRDVGVLILPVVHHLVVDGVSWRILIAELQALLSRASRDGIPAGPGAALPTSASYQRWVSTLAKQSKSGAFNQEIAYWRARDEMLSGSLVGADEGFRTLSVTDVIERALDVETTDQLVRDRTATVPIDHVLLTALGRALATVTGADSHVVDVEGHGRSDPDLAVDVSATVGWFTTFYPVPLRTPVHASSVQSLRAVRDELRRVPRGGVGYGVLRTWQRSVGAPRDVLFNYLGRLVGPDGDPDRWSIGEAAAASTRREHALELIAIIAGERLRLTWRHDTRGLPRARAERVADAFELELRRLLPEVRGAELELLSPADFPLARLSDEELALVLASHPEGVEDIYPLAPIQSGFLFHALTTAGSEDPYVIKFECTLGRELDEGALSRAWDRVVERHVILRTRFVWEGLAEPVQVVRRPAAGNLVVVDMRGASSEMVGAAVTRAIFAARVRSIEEPLRVTVFRTDGDHRLLWTVHHAVSDAWSMSFIFQELVALYDAEHEGRAVTLPEVPPYRSFIAWLGEQSPDASEKYFRAYLAGFSTPTTLPSPASVSAELTRELDADATQRIIEGCRAQGLTLSTMVQAAWGLVLARTTNEEDVVFGATTSGRGAGIPGIDRMTGVFINTLPVRVRLTEERVGPWLQRLQREQNETREHEHTPLVRIQAWSEVPHGHELFDTVLGFENFPRANTQGARESTLRIIDGDTSWRTHYGATLSVRPGERLSFVLHGTRVGHAASALLDRFAQVLVWLADDPTTSLREIGHPTTSLRDVPLLLDREREQLLLEWNATDHVFAHDAVRPVHEAFAERARLCPDVVALVFEDTSATYAELSDWSTELSARLIEAGVARGALVPLVVERGFAMVTAILGVMKAGAAYVPIDPQTPPLRLRGMLDELKASVLLVASPSPTLGELAQGLAGLPLLDVDAVIRAPRKPSALAGACAVTGLSPAYAIYTSGSTGKPKGTVNTHEGLANRLAWMQATFPIGVGSRVLHKTPYTFDVSVWELLWPLLHGATMVIARPDAHKDPEYVADLIRRERVSLTHFVPSMLEAFLEARGLAACASLKRVIVSGEALSPAIVKRFAERLPGAALENLYGPTEAAIDVSWWSSDGEGAVVPIGRPIANTRLHVVDRELALLPPGAPGELCISGIQLAQGYLARPELTAERFVPDPFATALGQRMYRTGDLARWLSDGNIEYLGRIDHQVKLRGFRIELGDIEATLARQPGVRSVTAMVREDVPGDRRLVAYVVPAPNAPTLAPALVEGWSAVFDAEYRGEAKDPTFDISSWTSSYDERSLPAEEMRTWVDETIAWIGDVRGLRVLEIGSGTGLLLFRLADRAASYVGTDVSARALGLVTKSLGLLGDKASSVTLFQRAAHELGDFPDGSFDVVVLNSVAQYFPDRAYLDDVLGHAVRLVRDGGRVHVGDVRSWPLLRTFRFTVRGQQAMEAGALRDLIEADVGAEKELVVAPAVFDAFAAASARPLAVEARWKRGAYVNELSRFRYDVTLLVGPSEPHSSRVATVSWAERGAVPDADVVLLTGVPNARLAPVLEAHRALEALATDAPAPRWRELARSTIASDPYAVQVPSYRVHAALVTSELAPATCDLVLVRHGAPVVPPAIRAAVELSRSRSDALDALTTDPGALARDAALVASLRRAAVAELPEYMVPSAFVTLRALPLTSSGKVDRKALPAAAAAVIGVTYVAPRDATELALAKIFAEVLRAPRVGVHDDFFALGGHSLLATQVVSRLRSELGHEVPLRAFLDHRTVGQLASLVARGAQGSTVQRDVALVRVPRGQALAASFAQERLWFLERLEGPSAAYNVAAALRLRGKLDVLALGRALDALVARHESLRTRLAEVDGVCVQRIVPPFSIPLAIVPCEEAVLGALLCAAQATPFDVECDLLVRIALFRVSEEDHALSLTLHHAITDGWSQGILVAELAAFYRAFIRDEALELSPLPFAYADFASWQRIWLDEAELRRQTDFWRQNLAGIEPIELPHDKPRPPTTTYAGAGVDRWVAAHVHHALSVIARGEGATLYMVLLAAFAAFLHRETGHADVAIGSPVAGRSRRELEPIVGMFVNTLVMRVDVAGEPSFRELVQRARAVSLDAWANQDAPFERVVEAVAPPRDRARTPLFQVLFVLQNAPVSPVTDVGLRLESIATERTATKFELELEVFETDLVAADGTPAPGGLSLRWTYNVDLFEASSIAQMARRFEVLLEAIAADARCVPARAALLEDEERRVLLQELSGANVLAVPERTLVACFEESVRRFGDHVAVRDWRTELSYVELDQRANALATKLTRSGVRREDVVAILTPASADFVVAILGILKAGAAFLPIDPTLPSARLALLGSDARPRAVVTTKQGAVRVRESWPPETTVVLATGERSERGPTVPIRPANLAYVIYTSGSTGTPKGALVAHAGVVNASFGILQTLGMSETSTTLQIAALGFDGALSEVFPSLFCGGTLVFAERDAIVRGLGEVVRQGAITVATMTPSALATLDEADLAGLQTLAVGGEACPPDLMRRFGQRFRFRNLYGPTETSICATSHDGAKPDGVAPIGRPYPGVCIYVLDAATMDPVPTGAIGEAFIGGIGVTRGYLGRADLAAERYVPDPFGPPGARLYRTGDRVRWRSDGTLDYFGRHDGQVKLRGYRIEVGEVESALAALDGVRAAAVVLREGPGGKRLVGFVVPSEDSPLDGDVLREALKSRVPQYMVPSELLALPELPLTRHGKVDRRALDVAVGTSLARVVVEGPGTATEESVLEVFRRVLARDDVRLDDNFFEQGGHSLLSAKVVARLRQHYTIALRDLFDCPTARELARRLEEKTGEKRASEASIPRVDRSGPSAASFAQERLWFLESLTGPSANYVVALALRLKGALSVRSLRLALDALVARHESLRTSISSQDGACVQVVADRFDLPLEITPCEESDVVERVSVESATPFDLAHDALVRARLFRVEDDDHALTLMLHHAITDGWSQGILLAELAKLYGAIERGEDPARALPPLTIGYVDFAAWQRAWLDEHELGRQTDYWVKTLRGAEPLELPTDRPRPPRTTHAGGGIDRHVDAEVQRSLGALAQREGATLYMVLLAAYAAFLQRHTGQTDLTIGSPIAGRSRPELEPIVGMFLNTLVMRVDVSGEPTFAALVGRVREVALGAWAHQDAPFERVVEAVAPPRDPSRTPLFQTLFVLQNTPITAVESVGLELAPLEVERRAARFDLDLDVFEAEDGLRCLWTYNTDLFDHGTVLQMVDRFERLLVTFAADPTCVPARVSMLDARAREEVVFELSGARVPGVDEQKTLVDCFNETVGRFADRLAVRDWTTRLTYRELDERVNAVAARLRAAGVRREDVVAVLTPASVDFVVAVMAVLKAGAAFLPIDPALPHERLLYIATDAKPRAVLATGELASMLAGTLPSGVALITDFSGRSVASPGIAISPANLAYVIYTSGSTGRPKGTLVPHAGVVNATSGIAKTLGMDASSQTLQIAALGFDGALSEVFPSLFTGGTLVFAAREAIVQGLGEVLVAEKITVATMTPTTLASIDERALENLRTLAVGGEACPPDLMRRFGLGGNLRFRNLYGPTETSICVTSHDGALAEGVAPVGRPYPGVRVYVLDPRTFDPVPRGVVGEAFIGGIAVTRGYLERPELAAERFVPDPFSERGERLYRTGDRVRWRQDGTLDYLGRSDAQIKIRGYRIELGEIESALAALPGVRGAAVTVRDGPGGKRLVGFLIAEQPPPEAAAVRQQLAIHLPPYMVPAELRAVTALPLNANGKVDRRALASLMGTSLAGSDLADEHRTATEDSVLAVFREVLASTDVRVSDNFFEIGGHSLLATQVIARLRRTFAIELPLRDVFERPSARELALRIDELQKMGAVEPSAPEKKRTIGRASKAGRHMVRTADGLTKKDPPDDDEPK